MAARAQCLAKPGGKPCVNRCGTSHPFMPEYSLCFSCKETVTVTRESARLSTEGVPLRSADCIKKNFQGVCTDYQHPNGSVGAGELDFDSAQTLAAQKTLAKQRERWSKVMKILVNTKSAVQHIVDVLEPLREKDEVVAPMSDDSLLQHLQFAEAKLQLIAAAFASMDEAHREQLTSLAQVGMTSVKPSAAAKKDPFGESAFEKGGKDEAESDEEFEEDMEEDVMDRNALKKQSTSIVDKGAKKKKPKKRRQRDNGD